MPMPREVASARVGFYNETPLQKLLTLRLSKKESQGSVTKGLLCIPVQRTYECKTRGEERRHCPPRGEADAHNSGSIPWQDALPYAFKAGLDSNLFVTLPSP
jgi:hypothetical protein